jgi:hypothetical protein
MYETPMVLMALVGSNAPTNVTSGGPLGVRTYHDIAKDIVDYIAWGQTDGLPGEGGWRYSANYGDSDNSASQWPVLGLMAAHLWGIDAPAWVKSELLKWTTADQNLSGNSISNYFYGSFDYLPGASFNSIAESAAGIVELTYCGYDKTYFNITAAEGYINRDWTISNGHWRVNIGSLYAMYAVMKAMKETTPTPIQFIANYDGTPGVEWYNGTGEYADALVTNQSSNGNWTDWVAWFDRSAVPTDLSTAWGVLILEFVPVKVLYKLTVHVVDAKTNNPILGANVMAAGPQNLAGVTDGGTLVFNNIQAGPYVVSASKLGYTSASISVSLTQDTETTIRLSTSVPVGGESTLITLQVLSPITPLELLTSWIVLALIATAFAIVAHRRLLKKHW